MSTHAMKHLSDLRSLYDRSLGTKHAYSATLSTHIRDQIHITGTHHRWQRHVAETTEACHTAKRISLTIYTDSATTLGLYKWYQRHLHRLHEYTSTRQGYAQQLLCYARHWAYSQRLETLTYQKMHTLNNTRSRQVRPQLYLRRKRPKRSGTPPCGGFPCFHHQNGTKCTGILTNGRSTCTDNKGRPYSMGLRTEPQTRKPGYALQRPPTSVR